MTTNNTTGDNDVLMKTGVEIEGAEAIEDLEKKFKEINAGTSAKATSTSTGQVISTLKTKLKQLEQIQVKLGSNLTTLKEKVKKDLDNLKTVKEQVENELAKIRDLEKMKEKIDSEIEKIQELEKNEESIDEEVRALEEEVKI